MDIVVLKKVKTSLLVPIGEKIIFDKMYLEVDL